MKNKTVKADFNRYELILIGFAASVIFMLAAMLLEIWV